MNNRTEEIDHELNSRGTSRRSFIGSSLSLAAMAMVGIGNASAQSASGTQPGPPSNVPRKEKSMDHRKLGPLEVSSIGLGCLPFVGYYV